MANLVTTGFGRLTAILRFGFAAPGKLNQGRVLSFFVVASILAAPAFQREATWF